MRRQVHFIGKEHLVRVKHIQAQMVSNEINDLQGRAARIVVIPLGLRLDQRNLLIPLR
jgi:hypothetical protein